MKPPSNKSKVIRFIEDADPTRSGQIQIHFGSIASVGQVIDIPGYFNDTLTPQDRKTVALEMESYGVARACEIVRNGETQCLILKSVMDNTQKKNDKAKPWAAWTSATALRCMLENGWFAKP